MPLYEYRCPNCNSEKELLQGMESKEGILCDKCGVGMIKKPTCPAIIKISGIGGYPIRSKGYKESYSQEYLKDVPEA